MSTSTKSGIIDTSLIEKVDSTSLDKKHSKHRHRHSHRSGHRDSSHRKDYAEHPPPINLEQYDRYEELMRYGERKTIPECIALTREAEKRKSMIKARQKKKEKRHKYKEKATYGKYGKPKPESYNDEMFHVPRSNFGNGGAYRYKNAGGKFGRGPPNPQFARPPPKHH